MIVPKSGRLLFAGWAFNDLGAADEALHVGLFGNDFTPDVDSVLGGFTPSAFTGFHFIDTDRSRFNGVALSTHIAVSRLKTLGDDDFFRWSVDALPETVYGWYAWHDTSEAIIGCDRFTVPIVPVVGTVITIYLDYDLGKLVAD